MLLLLKIHILIFQNISNTILNFSTLWHKMIIFSCIPFSNGLKFYVVEELKVEKEKEGMKIFLLIFSYFKATFLNATSKYFRFLKIKYRNNNTQPTINKLFKMINAMERNFKTTNAIFSGLYLIIRRILPNVKSII